MYYVIKHIGNTRGCKIKKTETRREAEIVKYEECTDDNDIVIYDENKIDIENQVSLLELVNNWSGIRLASLNLENLSMEEIFESLDQCESC